MKVNLKTLGCRLNEAESETWAEQFQNAGHSIVRSPAQADLIVLNSCAVTSEAGRKSRQMIRRLHRENPTAKLIVSGCYATLDSEQAAAEIGVDLIVPNPDKDRLVELVRDQVAPDVMPSAATQPGQVSLFRRGRQRAFVKVQDGCRYRCSFCIVTVARGEEKSRPIAEVIDQINHLHRQGVQEVVLTGVHLGGYGTDLGSDLATLIRQILEYTEIPRLRLGSLEPWNLRASFFDLFCNPRLMPHLHLPLQSGSDAVLRRMARRCKVADFMSVARQARSSIPDLNLTTDIIVGFPGESDLEWRESLENIEKIGFGQLHIFTYSARAGTRAARLAGQVPRSIKKARSRTLHRLAEKMKKQTLRRYLGRRFPVLWEALPDDDDRGYDDHVGGYTPNYLRVCVSSRPGLENTIRTARLSKIVDSENVFLGQIEDDAEPPSDSAIR